MPKVSGKWTGLQEIINDFKRLGTLDAAQIKQDLMQLIGDTCVKLLQQYSPKDTGDYSRGWKIISISADQVQVGNDNDELVDILEGGTDPRTIEPRVGRQNGVLVFEMNGQTVFSRYVNHPGTPAQPHIQTVQNIMDELMIEFIQAIMAKHSPLFSNGSIPSIPKKSNIQNIGGLAKFNRNVGKGRIHITRPRTGRRIFKRRLGLRRRTGQSIRNIQIG